MKKHTRQITAARPNHGSALGIVAICALLIVIAIVAIFQFSVFLGGSQELKNTVDAASLNVAKRAVENKVIAPTEFKDVADCSGCIGLATINRVWGKAFLINANAQEAQLTGFGNGKVTGSAQAAYSAASNLNAKVYQMLNSKDAADVHFNRMARDKPAKLLGAEGGISSPRAGDYATACIYRGEESNIMLDPEELPQGATVNQIVHAGVPYLQGYNPMQARW